MKKTNRTFKRFAAITSASLLAACAMAPVFTSMTSYAAETGTITFSATNNEYRAYRIFTGTAVKNGFGDSAMMSNIQWDMTATNAATFLGALKTDARFKTDDVYDFASCETAEDVAGVLTDYGYDNAKTKLFAEFVVERANLLQTSADSTDGVITLSGDINDGYYVIAQTSYNGATTSYILGVYDASAGADVEVKTEVPSFEKFIKDANDTTPVANEAWQKSADYDIGDMVPFKLVATLPDDYSTYNEYKIVFHDKLDAGLTYIASGDGYIAPKLIVDDVEVTDENAIATNASPTHDATKCNLEFTIDDVTKYTTTGNKVEVIFYAQLNENAKIGSEGNWNNAYMEYSNNPYYTSGDGNDANNDEDGIDNDGDGKIDEEDTDGESTETTDESTIDNVVAFTYQTIINKVDENGDKLTGAEFKLEKKVDGNWVEVTKVLDVTENVFTFKGLDDGTYKLSETKTPAAEYNKIADIEFEIIADHSDGKVLKSLNGVTSVMTGDELTINFGTQEGTVDFANGAIIADIENKQGTQLPGTGGIGTTIFYLGGGAMAAIGGVYLISKRRMKKSEE